MKYYIAYGSNLNLAQMERRCPDACVVGPAILHDYELVFRGHEQHAVASIEKKAGSQVPVVIWSISPSDEKSLDRYEGWPRLYIKKHLKVQLRDKNISAMAYVMTQGRCYGSPSSHYLDTIVDGYDSFGFDMRPLFDAAERDAARAGCIDAAKIKKYRLCLEMDLVTDNMEASLQRLGAQGITITGVKECE